MRVLTFASLLLISQVGESAIVRRASQNTCADLKANSNNGNRKIALVIDSSASMLTSDPSDLRLSAARTVNDWLISKSEASSKKKADLVTVIDFSSDANLDYPIGDPAGANSTFDKIEITGGTFIASGVEMAIEQLTQSGTGTTDKRSGILVFTDGEDSSTTLLVDQINRASSLGIRVSFGFLDASASVQDGEVLGAIMRSGGRYSTIYGGYTASAFINLVLVNGLTTNDNPGGSESKLLAGLSVSRFISGSNTATISYDARPNEIIDFTVESVDAGRVTTQAVLNGKVADKSTFASSSTSLSVIAKDGGRIDIQVKATAAPKDSIIVVGATSNLPTQNCTVGIGSGGGLSAGGKAGLGLGIPVLVALLGCGSFFIYKHFFHAKTPVGNHGTPHYIGDQDPVGYPPAEKTIDPLVQSIPVNPFPGTGPPGWYPPPNISPQAPMMTTPLQPQTFAVPPMPPMFPPKKTAPQNKTSENQSDQNQTGDNPNSGNTSGDQPNNNTSDNSSPQDPNNNANDDCPSGDDSDGSGPDQDDHDKHKRHKRRKHKRRKRGECECLQCKNCYDCGTLCSPECRTDFGRDCGPECRVHCKHDGDCDDKKAHKEHRHRCHRCRKHMDHPSDEYYPHNENLECDCDRCEACCDCGSDCGPGCEGDEIGEGTGRSGHKHRRHRCKDHLKLVGPVVS